MALLVPLESLQLLSGVVNNGVRLVLDDCAPFAPGSGLGHLLDLLLNLF